ncbi:hypothetical protein GGR56DRAFT_533513 [Xylariaceae sp. FL0804]|nr:hypothetical protein GGR56DRAFT_533513 [Xylariaceae sp. FL0804]
MGDPVLQRTSHVAPEHRLHHNIDYNEDDVFNSPRPRAAAPSPAPLPAGGDPHNAGPDANNHYHLFEYGPHADRINYDVNVNAIGNLQPIESAFDDMFNDVYPERLRQQQLAQEQRQRQRRQEQQRQQLLWMGNGSDNSLRLSNVGGNAYSQSLPSPAMPGMVNNAQYQPGLMSRLSGSSGPLQSNAGNSFGNPMMVNDDDGEHGYLAEVSEVNNDDINAFLASAPTQAAAAAFPTNVAMSQVLPVRATMPQQQGRAHPSYPHGGAHYYSGSDLPGFQRHFMLPAMPPANAQPSGSEAQSSDAHVEPSAFHVQPYAPLEQPAAASDQAQGQDEGQDTATSTAAADDDDAGHQSNNNEDEDRSDIATASAAAATPAAIPSSSLPGLPPVDMSHPTASAHMAEMRDAAQAKIDEQENENEPRDPDQQQYIMRLETEQIAGAIQMAIDGNRGPFVVNHNTMWQVGFEQPDGRVLSVLQCLEVRDADNKKNGNKSGNDNGDSLEGIPGIDISIPQGRVIAKLRETGEGSNTLNWLREADDGVLDRGDGRRFVDMAAAQRGWMTPEQLEDPRYAETLRFWGPVHMAPGTEALVLSPEAEEENDADDEEYEEGEDDDDDDWEDM